MNPIAAFRIALVPAALLAAAGTASAQWTATVLHPPGAANSWCTAVSNGQQVGIVDLGSGLPTASRWTGTAASWVNLNPPDAFYSESSSAAGTKQFGNATFDEQYYQGGFWTGTANSWVSLTPSGYPGSVVTCTNGAWQGGAVNDGFADRAAIWNGTAESWVDLYPGQGDVSIVYGVTDTLQVGLADLNTGKIFASLWTGTPESWINLNPPGSNYGIAQAAHGAQQVGVVELDEITKAVLWTGTPESMVVLAPAGSPYSSAQGVFDGVQCGVANLGGIDRAGVWSGTAASWVDLHGALPSGYDSSAALAIWSDATTTVVVGYAVTPSGALEAVMWTAPKAGACYADCDVNGTLNIDDFICFQTLFALGDPAADCDASGGLNIDDFICFQTFFALGC